MELVIGKTYLVDINDCCVEGEFTSTLIKALGYDDDDNLVDVTELDYGTFLEFKNGVKLRAMNGVSITAV